MRVYLTVLMALQLMSATIQAMKNKDTTNLLVGLIAIALYIVGIVFIWSI